MKTQELVKHITAQKNRKFLILGSFIAVALVAFIFWNQNKTAQQQEQLVAGAAVQQQVIQQQQQQQQQAQQQGALVTAVVAVDPASGAKICQNAGLAFSSTMPENWFCLKQHDQPEVGNIFMTNGALVIEIENLGRGIGCNPENIECTLIPFYSDDLVELNIAQINGENRDVFGIFKDTTDDRSYGGIVIRRTEGPLGVLTPEETQEITSILEKFQRIGQ